MGENSKKETGNKTETYPDGFERNPRRVHWPSPGQLCQDPGIYKYAGLKLA